jgi:hypothetical protein
MFRADNARPNKRSGAQIVSASHTGDKSLSVRKCMPVGGTIAPPLLTCGILGTLGSQGDFRIANARQIEIEMRRALFSDLTCATYRLSFLKARRQHQHAAHENLPAQQIETEMRPVLASLRCDAIMQLYNYAFVMEAERISQAIRAGMFMMGWTPRRRHRCAKVEVLSTT